jgi:hypothetical protein
MKRALQVWRLALVLLLASAGSAVLPGCASTGHTTVGVSYGYGYHSPWYGGGYYHRPPAYIGPPPHRPPSRPPGGGRPPRPTPLPSVGR